MALESMLHEVTFSQIWAAETCPCLSFVFTASELELSVPVGGTAKARARALFLCLSGVMITK